ncbi:MULTISPECIES: DUF3313 domain-containing protein [Enterobacteriaceae]|uniref:DUF3313 domain-containing protein n=1 Tax=Raoultella lignicola TaxID=3040939 RepID=A0ABU9F9W9_9ENTR|nr:MULTISPECIES: DUF3313 domain-containing protein [Enterobacteriaceae]MRT48481.1 DUF3313 family protein [Raoultella sp. RIT712]QNK09189.1 DUF3313 domain-containing protein [Enterobacter sp. JUb54]ROS15560.1 uncharacterized protein DUF3313 [Raoultella sp. BIGb0399]
MRTHFIFKVAALAGLLALAGCASKIASPEKYSGFLKDYSKLKETTSASGKPELRWISADYNPKNYDNVVFNPVIYYPVPKPTTQVGENALRNILNYTNQQLKQAIGERKPLAATPGPRSLIFRGAITGVDSSKEGLQFYEVIPVAMVVAGTEMATGHRTMNTSLYFEAELIDAATNKPVMKVVRKGEGKNLANENTQLTADTLKQVIDEMAIDAVKFDPTQK